MIDPRRMVPFGSLVAAALLAGCSRDDWEDNLARLPGHMLEAACLASDYCTVYCDDGSKKSDRHRYWCERD